MARSVVVLLAIGFVPALVIAWVFELTPEGLKRDADVDPAASIAPQTARRMDRMLLMLAVLWLVHRLVHSYYGNALRALRDRREVIGGLVHLAEQAGDLVQRAELAQPVDLHLVVGARRIVVGAVAGHQARAPSRPGGVEGGAEVGRAPVGQDAHHAPPDRLGDVAGLAGREQLGWRGVMGLLREQGQVEQVDALGCPGGREVGGGHFEAPATQSRAPRRQPRQRQIAMVGGIPGVCVQASMPTVGDGVPVGAKTSTWWRVAIGTAFALPRPSQRAIFRRSRGDHRISCVQTVR